MSLFATKPIDKIIAESEEQGEHTLKRALGPVALTALGVGAIIGTGIFVLTGQAAAAHAGPAVVISMIIAGIVSALAALCYSEFASSVPISGSAYAYGYATLGEFVAWIIGWDLILEYAFGAATVAVGWSGYVVSFLDDLKRWTGLPVQFPASLSAAPGTVIKMADGTETVAIFNLPSFLIAIAVTALLVKGIKESANFNSFIVVLKTLVVILFIIAGIGYVSAANYEPFIPAGTGKFGEFGYSGILAGAAVIFFAYVGFDAVSTAAQEAKNPARDMPIGILGSLVICTILYVLVSGVMVGVVSYTELNVPAPIAVAVNAAGLKAAGTPFGAILNSFQTIIKVGAILGLSSTMVVMVLGQPRIFYSMSKDGLLPAWASKIHPKFRTPYVTTIITGTIVAIMASFFDVSTLGELVSIGTLFAFVIVSLGVIILRSTNPDLPRPFKVPFSPILPAVSAFAAAYLMNGLGTETWLRLIDWMSIGLFVYFAYSYKNSKLAFIGETDEQAIHNAGEKAPNKAPISPVITMLLIIFFTFFAFGLSDMFVPADASSTTRIVETAMRLFVWVMVAIMVYFLTLGRKNIVGQARNMSIARVGLLISLVNIVVWAIVTYWFFIHYKELHG